MIRRFAAILSIASLLGCSDRPSNTARLSPKEKEMVEVARRAVRQFEDWGDKAEFKIVRRGTQWHVTALRVVYPEATGNKRYVPWGQRYIVIDDAGKVISYANNK